MPFWIVRRKRTGDSQQQMTAVYSIHLSTRTLNHQGIFEQWHRGGRTAGLRRCPTNLLLPGVTVVNALLQFLNEIGGLNRLLHRAGQCIVRMATTPSPRERKYPTWQTSPQFRTKEFFVALRVPQVCVCGFEGSLGFHQLFLRDVTGIIREPLRACDSREQEESSEQREKN